VDKTAKIWSVATGEEVVTLRGHTAAVNFAAFNPDGREIITASADGVSDTCEITVWPLRDPCLTGLSIDHGTLEGGFDVKNLAYTVNVGPDIASISLTPAISDDSGTIKINGETAANGSPHSVSLNWGKNVVSISAVSQDETVENSYTVCVYRHTGTWKNVGQTICPADSLSYPRIVVTEYSGIFLISLWIS
jgi:WD40 repeat protein